jgi:hypothetical protein
MNIQLILALPSYYILRQLNQQRRIGYKPQHLNKFFLENLI